MVSYTVKQLAALVGGIVEGNADIEITGISDIEEAKKGQITFLSNPRYESAVEKTQASAIVVSKSYKGTSPATLIRVESPSLAFSEIVSLFSPKPVSYEAGIHPTAIIGKAVEIGKEVSIQPYAVIEDNVKIGDGCVIGAFVFIGKESVVGEKSFFYPHVTIRERSRIGKRVIIHSGAVIGSDGFGYELKNGRHEKIPQVGIVQIDDDVEIGANTTVDRGRFGKTWIQEGCKIDNLVQIAHNVIIGKNSIIAAQTGISGSTSLGDNVTLAGQVGIGGHIHIGQGATITAQSGVTKDVPPRAILSGRHARPISLTHKLEALYNKLPEIWERLRKLEKKQGEDVFSTEDDSCKAQE
ncbi:UDP-3-O-(3-hydroxymyristoyl)glucosamine N-acyltransferase [Methylacidiphilum caldifontis]|uniref:UDP-3-O-(3-hydroxymyristoyl)glucosamine N-acyltransferase n=1 Tax=Methylacidiphilum caldifontis TaxID=2795386 RepID=UPI001A8D8DE0|nr:UDP-3-O-(3-hydroxymyristoyl)glucosamine N-acyltransferase [Methylacidiphilum caldifontis]QSR89251.1 UDP-3-O-(3-hydroxymyristoyl)glucosamine N-acyltransferase [Methylacidiphilum caldifontis]